MAITRFGSGSGRVAAAGAATLKITFATTETKFLVAAGSVAYSGANAADPTLVDNLGTSWTVKAKRNVNGATADVQDAFVIFRENAPTLSSITITFPDATSHSNVALDQFSGVQTSGSFDTQTVADGIASTNAWASGNLTAAAAGALIYGAASGDDSSNNPWTAPGAPWTEIFQFGDTTTQTATETIFQVGAGTGPFSATFNYTGMVSGTAAGCSILTSFLALNAPSIDNFLTDKYTYLGNVVTFSIAATTSGGALTYQWQSNESGSFASISNNGDYTGVTAADLTVLARQVKNNILYRCIVTDSNGSSTSTSAALRIFWQEQFWNQPVTSPKKLKGYNLFNINAWQGFSVEKWFAHELTRNVAPVTYTFSVSGSYTFSGTYAIRHVRKQVPAGSITYSGTAVARHVRKQAPTGTLTYSGTAPFLTISTKIFAVSGGMVFSGTATRRKTRVSVPSGSITYTGTATFRRIRKLVMSGAMLFSGVARLIKTKIITATGTLTFSGSAGITFVSAGGAGTSTNRLRMMGFGT